MIVIATEEDIPRILEIERDSISPPWSHGALLSEIYNDDSFFALSAGAQSRDIDAQTVGQSPSCAAVSLPAGAGTAKHGEVFGFIIMRRAADEGELLQVAVDEHARRRGAADGLMGAALGWARGNGVKSVYLEVRKSNEAAIGLYGKHGFVRAGVRKGYYSGPDEDAVLMRREL